MAGADAEAWQPPLLSWKGMQLWSAGCRAPAFCEIFMGFKATKLSNLLSSSSHHQKKKGKRRKRRPEREVGERSSPDDSPRPPPPRCSSLQLPGRLSCRSPLDDVPQRHSISFEPSGRISNQLSRNSNAMTSNLKQNSDNLRRNSDASVGNLQRFSTSSSSPCGGYERVWMLEGVDDGRLDYMLPREVKLGGRRSDVSLHLGRQDSGMFAYRRSSCSSFSSSSSVASAASAAVKIASRRSSASSSEGEQRHLSQLLVGNQFLTHLTAAPVPMAIARTRPSDGFLLDGSLRCRDAELKDRIIFFL